MKRLTSEIVDDFKKWYNILFEECEDSDVLEISFKELSIRVAEYVLFITEDDVLD